MIFTILQATGGANPLISFLPFILIIVVVYFLMIRPQQKRAKRQRNFLGSLRKGQKIVTIGGIHGRIREIGDQTLGIEVAPNTRITIEKSAVSQELSEAHYPLKDSSEEKS